MQCWLVYNLEVDHFVLVSCATFGGERGYTCWFIAKVAIITLQ